MNTHVTPARLRAVRLSFAESGPRDALPIILLHGYSDSHLSMAPLIAALGPDRRMIAITQRGHGDSDKPVGDYDVDHFASDIAKFMDRERIPCALIVGHSMGSIVGQRFAALYPDRTAGLVLMSAFDDMAANPVVRDMWDNVISPMRDPVDPGFVRDFQASTLANPVPGDFFEMVVAESLKLPARVWREVLYGNIVADLAPDRARIDAPTLILWGDRDAICDEPAQKRLLREIVESRMIVLRGLGHAPHWEAPDAVAREIDAFANELAL
jgi:pimeloyl-ACP methyl ester carboxylesterase